MIAEPRVWHKKPLPVPVNTNAIIEVDPVIFFYENDTKRLKTQERKCVYSVNKTKKNLSVITSVVTNDKQRL